MTCGFARRRKRQAPDVQRRFLPGFLPRPVHGPTLAAVKLCIVCGWQAGKRKGRCDACETYLRRHGHDKDIAAVQRGWERAIDKAFDLKGWR